MDLGFLITDLSFKYEVPTVKDPTIFFFMTRRSHVDNNNERKKGSLSLIEKKDKCDYMSQLNFCVGSFGDYIQDYYSEQQILWM